MKKRCDILGNSMVNIYSRQRHDNHVAKENIFVELQHESTRR